MAGEHLHARRAANAFPDMALSRFWPRESHPVLLPDRRHLRQVLRQVFHFPIELTLPYAPARRTPTPARALRIPRQKYRDFAEASHCRESSRMPVSSCCCLCDHPPDVMHVTAWQTACQQSRRVAWRTAGTISLVSSSWAQRSGLRSNRGLPRHGGAASDLRVPQWHQQVLISLSGRVG